MRYRRAAVVFLAGVNLFLGALLLTSSVSLPTAHAQSAPGRAGDYVCVTAKAAGQTYDVLYLLDVPNQKLHGFYPPNVMKKELVWAGFRDLKQDFPAP